MGPGSGGDSSPLPAPLSLQRMEALLRDAMGPTPVDGSSSHWLEEHIVPHVVRALGELGEWLVRHEVDFNSTASPEAAAQMIIHLLIDVVNGFDICTVFYSLSPLLINVGNGFDICTVFYSHSHTGVAKSVFI